MQSFHPADWSPVCDSQMRLYNEILREFRKLDAELLGISVEGVWCHAAFARCAPVSNPRATSTVPIAQARASAGAHHFGGRVRLVFRHSP